MNEEKHLREYDGWIKRCVNAYIARGKNQSAELREDLYQEARMTFVEFMRKNGTPPYDKATMKTCLRYIDCQLYRMIIEYRGVGFTHKSFKENKDALKSVEISDEVKNTISVEDEDITEIDDWMNHLPYKQKIIVMMRMAGFTFEEIAQRLDSNERYIREVLGTQIRSSYKEYFSVA